MYPEIHITIAEEMIPDCINRTGNISIVPPTIEFKSVETVAKLELI
jgi:hypothetical protein